MIGYYRLTMLELIVLVIVIGILFVILMPGCFFHRHSREKARRANCAGNVKTIGVAMLMYSGDSSGLFPLTEVGNSLEPLNQGGYLADSKVYGCPSHAEIGTTAANSNYWYVGSGLRDNNETASETRLAFDMFGNHGGRDNEWMNVLFVDGHYEGGKPGIGLPFQNDNAVIKATEEE